MDYRVDAYVIETGLSAPNTHAVVVDLIQPNGEISHQMVSMVFGENNAKMTAEQLNRWKNQVFARVV